MVKKQAKKATIKTVTKSPNVTTTFQMVARLIFESEPDMYYDDESREASSSVEKLQLWPEERLVAYATCGDTAMVCSDKETRMALAEWLASTLGCRLVPIEAT